MSDERLNRILAMPRFTCQCGRWIMLPDTFTREKPLKCGCGLQYFHEGGNVVRMPGVLAPALVLDLDGTVRYSKNGEFINKPEDVALFADVEARLWEMRGQGYLIFGVTNQGGVAFGHKSVLGHEGEIEVTVRQFERNPFHLIKACFHHPAGKVEPYNHRSLLREPDIGMLALCEVEAYDKGYIVDWDKSLMVGDRPEDEECARNAGIAFQWAHEFFGREQP